MKPITFSDLLVAGRKASGMTQTELSKASGVHRVYIAQIEGGERGAPSFSIVHKLCNALGEKFTGDVSAHLKTRFIPPKKSRKKKV